MKIRNSRTKAANSSKYIVNVNENKINIIKEKYKISDWEIIVDTNFTFKPNRANWKNKTVTIYPFNFWSYLKAGKSLKKRNKKYLAKVIAHEIRHAQQEPPTNSLWSQLRDVTYLYWFYPLEKDARGWSDKHWEKFQGIIKISER